MRLEKDALFEQVMGTRPLAATPREQLDERLRNRVYIQITNTNEGDFRMGPGSGAPAPGEYVAYIMGNAYEIKDELKKLGFRWEPKARHWYIRHTRMTGRAPRKNPSEKKVKKAVEGALKVINDHNLTIDKKNAQELKKAGFKPTEGGRNKKKSQKQLVKEIDRKVRAGKRFERYGVNVQTKFLSRTGGEESAVIEFSGNTYPIKDILKQAGFEFHKRSGDPKWVMPFLDYEKIQRQLEKRIFKSLRKNVGDRPAEKERSTGRTPPAERMKP